jgi:hypothetical protein
MKKLLFIITTIVLGSFYSKGQTSVEIKNFATSVIIPNNSIISETVIAGGLSHTTISVKNIGSVTKVFGITRVDLVLNTGSAAYFCFGGQCFTPIVFTSPAVNQLTLTPGQSNTTGVLYYEEDAVLAGYSEVKYKVFDVNNVADNVVFTFKFNSIVSSIKESYSVFAFVSDVFPNPSISKAQITVSSNVNIDNVIISITNALGSIVSTKNIDLSGGKNTVVLDTENLSSGLYFATILHSNTKIIKKFTLNK